MTVKKPNANTPAGCMALAAEWDAIAARYDGRFAQEHADFLRERAGWYRRRAATLTHAVTLARKVR